MKIGSLPGLPVSIRLGLFFLSLAFPLACGMVEGVQARMLFLQGWQELSPDQKRRALENYQMFQRLDPGHQENVEKNYQKWQRLPESQKEKLRKNFQRYRKMSPTERKEFDRNYRKWRRRR